MSLDFNIDPTQNSRAVSRSREHRAESLSIRELVAPKGIAIICDTVEPGSIGDVLVRNLVGAQFVGDIALISPDGQTHQAIPGYKTLSDVPAHIDLVLVSMPTREMDAVIDACAEVQVRAIVIVSGGFAEVGDYTRQREIVRRARRNGIRVLGPNALGLINTDPRVSLNASLVEHPPGRGRLGIFCQSGAFGSAIVQEGQRRGLGISTFVSAGNRADISANDMLQYWRDDDSTSSVLLHLEDFGNPRKFVRLARHLALEKPVVVVRSGRTTDLVPFGYAIRSSNLPSAAFNGIFDRAGLIQVDTLTELMDIASLLSFQPMPRGPRIGVISDSDALGAFAVDAAESLGLSSVGPARQLDPTGTVASYVALLTEVLDDPGVDSVVVCHAPRPHRTDDALAEALELCVSEATKPIAVVVLAAGSEPVVSVEGPHGLPGHGSVPVFADVESAMLAFHRIVRYIEWRDTPRGEVSTFADVEPERAHRILAGRLGTDPDPDRRVDLNDEDLAQLLDCYGIELSTPIEVDSEESAVEAAALVGYPAVMKTRFPGLAHRADLGGVRLNLENERSVRTAYLSMAATMGPDALDRLIVQRMAPPGVAVVAGTAEDPLFGPVIRFRLAGEIPRLLADYAYRIPPVTDRGAAHLIREPRAAAVLTDVWASGDSQGPSVNLEALEDLIMRLGRLADDLPELGWLELNPMIVHSGGVAVLNASGWVQRPAARTDLESRRLLA